MRPDPVLWPLVHRRKLAAVCVALLLPKAAEWLLSRTSWFDPPKEKP